jgi:hypothetical protein
VRAPTCAQANVRHRRKGETIDCLTVEECKKAMARIVIDKITLADAATPSVNIPNIVPRHAQALIVTARAPSLPANAAVVEVSVSMFQAKGKPALDGWFNSRDRYVGPITERIHVAGNAPHIFTVRVPHPPEPDDRAFAAATPLLLSPFWRALFEYYWHDGQGPYDAEVTLVAYDQNNAPLTDAATYNYPFVSV